MHSGTGPAAALSYPLGVHLKVPHGLAGGKSGQLGVTRVQRLDGTLETLRGCDQTELAAGEVVIVTTPTAGGFEHE